MPENSKHAKPHRPGEGGQSRAGKRPGEEGTRAGKGRGTRGGRQHQKGTAGPNMQEEKEKEAKRKGNEGSKVFDSFDLTRQVK